jgi:hypothetical protein
VCETACWHSAWVSANDEIHRSESDAAVKAWLALFTSECQALGRPSRANGVRTWFAAERPIVEAMEQKGLRLGHFLALAGALVAVVSLWRPWYRVEFPPELRDLFSSGGRLGSDPGLFGELVRGMAAAMPSSVSVSGWEALKGADVTIAVVAIGAVAVILAASGAVSGMRVDAVLAARAATLAGVAVLVVAVWHVVKMPGEGAASDWIHAASGLWMAIGGGAAMLGGGLWAGADLATPTGRPSASASGSLNTSFPPLTPDLPPVFAERPIGATASSVPPPRS